MRRELKMEITKKIYRMIWENFKAQYSMAELAEVLDIPVSKFFRMIKPEEKKGEEKKNK